MAALVSSCSGTNLRNDKHFSIIIQVLQGSSKIVLYPTGGSSGVSWSCSVIKYYDSL